jgi:hypothetical protein
LTSSVEPGAGAAALIPDDLYVAAGAAFNRDPWGCDIVVKVAPPAVEEVARLREGAVLIGFLTASAAPEMRAALSARRERVRGGGDPADQPRPGDGRPLLAGDDRGLQGGDRRRRARHSPVPDG